MQQHHNLIHSLVLRSLCIIGREQPFNSPLLILCLSLSISISLLSCCVKAFLSSSLLWTGPIVALTTDLGSDYFVAYPSVGLNNSRLCCCCLPAQLPTPLPKGNQCPAEAISILYRLAELVIKIIIVVVTVYFFYCLCSPYYSSLFHYQKNATT